MLECMEEIIFITFLSFIIFLMSFKMGLPYPSVLVIRPNVLMVSFKNDLLNPAILVTPPTVPVLILVIPPSPHCSRLDT